MLLQADSNKLSERVYNVTSMSFTPRELAASIKKEMPSFTIDYKPDFRQNIADSWPKSINDDLARRDWGWSPDYDIDAMTREMLRALRKRI